MKRDPKLWAALAYTLGLISGIAVLLVAREKHDDQYVRFHAMQSVLTFAAIALSYILLPTIPIIGHIGAVRSLFTMAVFCLWVLLLVKAVSGEAYRLPYVGDLAHSMTSK